MADEVIPFHTYLWKVASRCNINCDYCYVYNSVDDSWRRQPRLMSRSVAETAARRMVEHLSAHDQETASVIFHGGEPMMGGVAHLGMLTTVLREQFEGSGIRLSLGMQTNLLLLDEPMCDFLLANGFSIGVSLDGPPEINDRHRLDKRGRPTSSRLESALSLLTRERYRSIFGGFLCVIDPDTDPETVTDYLLSFDPIGIDFLLPLDNHDRRPAGKESLDATPYGEWLVRAYDRWMSTPNSTRIRIFQSIINMMCGGFSLVESIGLRPVDLIVVETNGEIQAVDSLKTTFQGATELGFHIERDSFDTVATHFGVRSRQLGALSLSKQCQRCELVEICGGGYLPHRYSAARGFDNPSVYCTDLKMIIRHINTEISAAVSPIIAESTMRAAANGFSSSAGMERAHEPLKALAITILAEVPSPKVVDLGCGDGTLVSQIAAATGAIPYGIELVPERVQAADRLLRQAGGMALAGNLYTADWPLPAQQVDLALVALSALVGAPPELRDRLQDTLATHATRTIVYAYDDDLARYGSLLEMARAADVTLTGTINGGLASEAVLPLSTVAG